MTKAKARARAKARAAAKITNPEAKSSKPDIKEHLGRFDPKSNSMRNTDAGANLRSNAGMQRGAARSR